MMISPLQVPLSMFALQRWAEPLHLEQESPQSSRSGDDTISSLLSVTNCSTGLDRTIWTGMSSSQDSDEVYFSVGVHLICCQVLFTVALVCGAFQSRRMKTAVGCFDMHTLFAVLGVVFWSFHHASENVARQISSTTKSNVAETTLAAVLSILFVQHASLIFPVL